MFHASIRCVSLLVLRSSCCSVLRVLLRLPRRLLHSSTRCCAPVRFPEPCAVIRLCSRRRRCGRSPAWLLRVLHLLRRTACSRRTVGLVLLWRVTAGRRLLVLLLMVRGCRGLLVMISHLLWAGLVGGRGRSYARMTAGGGGLVLVVGLRLLRVLVVARPRGWLLVGNRLLMVRGVWVDRCMLVLDLWATTSISA